MTKSRVEQITYIPLIEFAIFSILVTTSTVLYFSMTANLWILIMLIVFAYLATIQRATIINLTDTELKLTSLNPFLSSSSISINSIVKLTSTEAFDQMAGQNFGGSFYLFTRRYQVEYIDHNHEKIKSHFSILNKKKEKLIIDILTSKIRATDR